ncbi:hypothetical protein SFRURICE_006226 [Spodoptera frugiperda]|nr:hypothetical protein SFRURICE_006226 [Spodoptera frugiperda]
MPRNYKPDPQGKQYRKYDHNTIKQALEEYQTTPKCSLASIAEKYNINKSVLYRHNRKTMKTQGGQNALDEHTERHIVNYLNICGNWGCPLDRYDLRIVIKLVSLKVNTNQTTPIKWKSIESFRLESEKYSNLAPKIRHFCHSHSKYESNDTSQVKIHQAV